MSNLSDAKTVFISSTVFDLLDVRAELSSAIREMGMIPFASGCDDSEISALPTANSIETCLEHVRRADFVIVILDQRYGPRLGKAGFEDLSATHLEYKEALRIGKPLWLYARDRLEGDYRIWARNRQHEALTLRWAERSLVEFLHEHQKLDAAKTGSNWFDVFSDSTHLKRLVGRDLAAPAAKAKIRTLLERNALPSVSPVVESVHRSNDRVHVGVLWKNTGTTPAIDFVLTDDKVTPKSATCAFIGSDQEYLGTLTVKGAKPFVKETTSLVSEYKSIFGITVRDSFGTSCSQDAKGVTFGISLTGREFVVGSSESVPLNIRFESAIPKEPSYPTGETGETA